MKILLDTNVILDFLLDRPPWKLEADAILRAEAEGRIECCLTASTLTDIFYIASRPVGRTRAADLVRRCLEELAILPVDAILLRSALLIPMADFEDALQVACAIQDGLDGIVTRDTSGFPLSLVPVYSPIALMAHLGLAAHPHDPNYPA